MRGDRVLRLLESIQVLDAAEPVPDVVLSTLAREAVVVGSVAGAAVAVVRDASVDFRAATGLLSCFQGASTLPERSVFAAVIASGVPVLCADVCDRAWTECESDDFRRIAAFAVVPLLQRGVVTALILVGQRRTGMLVRADVEALEHLAGAASNRLQVSSALEVSAAALAAAETATHRLRAAMDSAVDGHTVYDAVLDGGGNLIDLRNAYLNPMGAAARGIDAASWVGGSLLETAQREGNLAVAHAYLSVARTGIPWRAQPQITTVLGRRTFALSVVPTGPSPSGIMVSFRDIDDEHRAALILAKTARLLDETQAMAGIGSWEWDIPGQLLTLSAGMSAICGTDPASSQITAAEFEALVHRDDVGHWSERVALSLAKGGRSEDLAYRITTPAGDVRHLIGWGHIEQDDDGIAVSARGGAQDVTDRVVREQALASSEEQFRLTLANSPIGLALVGLDGGWIQTNEALATIAGLTQEELWRQTYLELALPEDRDIDYHLIGELLAGTRDTYEIEKRYRHASGHVLWVDLHVAIVRNPQGEPLHYIAQILDVTEQRTATHALQALANTDPLTGLANRRAWEKGLSALLDDVTAEQCGLTLAILDIDYFKIFNDTFGHPAGDDLLCEVAAAWQAHLAVVAPRGLLARVGGEEFALALPTANSAVARATVEALLGLMPRGQTASAGITVVEEHDDTSSAMTRADAALYAAKRRGRNRCEVLLIG